MIDRRTFLSSLAVSTFISATSEARQLNAGVGSALSPDGRHWLPGPKPLPSQVHGVRRCIIDLNGAWQFSAGSPASFRRRDLEKLSWTEVQMPNELATLGLSVKQDVAYLLRRAFVIPQDFAGKAIVIRFDGVYSHARVWINGSYVRDHHGGFTSWDCEITPFVKAGERADLVVILMDRSDDPSQASTYAKHSIAGILRDVSLLALPEMHIEHLHVLASLDDQYSTGLLDVQASLADTATCAAASISLALRDPMGNEVPLQLGEPTRTGGTLKFEQIRIPDVSRWDSEHPHLYELIVRLHSGADLTIIRRSIGFRKIERLGNQLLVNGEAVILRGVCRHDIHPTRGRAPLRQYDEHDPVLLKKANINFVRTSHYPPTEAFLAACDRVGMYVEEETAVCFLNPTPQLNDRLISQLGEMVSRDDWHPSIILWSLGNESFWKPNFVHELKAVRAADPSRPVIFSWSDTTGMDSRSLDIYSSHYPLWDSDLGGSGFPVLHDEFAHVACYNTDDLRSDPGVRNFWGQSIAMFANRFLETPGCLGGAIWACIDEVFLLPDRVVGFGPWGIIDGWRREKPEFWLTRKAFSPVRLKDEVLPLPQSGAEPVITIGNGYNHTNLKELKIEWSVGDRHGIIQGPDVPPRSVSQLRIPVTSIGKGQILKLRFTSSDGSEVDRFELPVGARVTPAFSSPSGALQLQNGDNRFVISGTNFSLVIDRKTGLIDHGAVNGRTVIEGGPYLDLGQGRPSSWSLTKIDVRKLPHSILIAVSGASRHADKPVNLQFELEVFGDGRLDLHYRLTDTPELRKLRIDHLGMSLVLPRSVDRLMWQRRALWSVYPDDHIGRPAGVALRTSARSTRSFRTAPKWPWAEDMHEPFLDADQVPAGAATNDFRSMRENIFWAGCLQGKAREHLRVEALGDVAVRASPLASGQVDLNVYHFWGYPELEFGNYVGPRLPTVRPPSEHTIFLRMADLIADLGASAGMR